MGNHVYVALPVMAMLAILQSWPLPCSGRRAATAVPGGSGLGHRPGHRRASSGPSSPGCFADLFSIALVCVFAGFHGRRGRPLLPAGAAAAACRWRCSWPCWGPGLSGCVRRGLRLFGFGASLSGLTELLPLLAVHAVPHSADLSADGFHAARSAAARGVLALSLPCVPSRSAGFLAGAPYLEGVLLP